MNKRCLTLLLLLPAFFSCKNKGLEDVDPCRPDRLGYDVLVRVNWEDHARDKRQMRMSLFSQNHHAHLDRETIDDTGIKYVKLPAGSHFKPIVYDYYAKNIYFRNETVHQAVEAYSITATRATYRARVRAELPPETRNEPTVSEPSSFHYHAWDDDFRMETAPTGEDQVVIDFHPENVLREFTFCITNIDGANNVAHTRGAISGVSASMFLSNGALSTTRSTVLFENATASNEDVGTISGRFYTFGPVEDERGFMNLITIELMSVGNLYYSNTWDVSDQITESMEDRDAKLERDGYDILIENNINGDFPPIPPGETPPDGSGFRIDIPTWDDVTIFL